MVKPRIGVQMMMLKEKVNEEGIYNVLKKVHDLGYNSFEVSQIEMSEHNVSEMQRAINDLGIEISAMSCGVEDISETEKFPGDTLQNNIEKIIADCKAVNCNILRIGMLPINYMGSKAKALTFANKCEFYAKQLKAEGIDLYYHAHNLEFVKYDGHYMLDLMRDNTTLLGFELDIHWIWRAGLDSIAVLKNYKNRIRAIHLKDYRIGEIDMDQYPGEGHEKIYFMLHMITQFAELGEGNLPLPQIIQAGFDSGSEYFFVEQDALYGKDAYDCLVTSRDYLLANGYRDWF
ncbi:sugar phosphate isomerase/epimerase family protein [Staphylococcus gallinarum]|uniref:sugar phosphate isomerase/epimerase family protein n=1 Tax=Staphylococcus gallinarum TaxID=1293 RepID=UPI001E2FAB45|nr:sugar phosphate isomerase/epimerase [Staphylococcus gallinarum]MCD8919490.1 sugar phosphate isomerase/epimerase [Staphylococcus gallinarum]MEB6276965.1 sugar phosphate isomerase/epimerase [Staphylococcus gallinarum]UEH01627.1 sugar phosphate isomerase/epimerase [Staphylococcus gallinarum]